MNGLRQSVFKWVSGTHVAVLFLLLVIPWMRGCFRKEPKIIATFDLGAPPPPPPEVEPEPAPKPKPKPEPVKKPVPKPVVTNTPPKPKPVVTNTPPKPKPVATNPPPKKVEAKKPAVTNAPPKPKTEAERLAAIRQNNPVKRPVVKQAPALDFSGLKSTLNSAATSAGTSYGSGSGSGGGAYSPFAWYYDRVKQQMYSVWQQPSGAPIGLTASATLRVERDGTVSSKSITRRSGNLLFDQSVQNALNSTARLPVPPSDLPSRTIEIEFALSD